MDPEVVLSCSLQSTVSYYLCLIKLVRFLLHFFKVHFNIIFHLRLNGEMNIVLCET